MKKLLEINSKPMMINPVFKADGDYVLIGIELV